MTAHASLPVTETSQTSAVRFAARELADRLGFTETDSYRVGIVATELATNLVKHARSGEVLLRATPGLQPEVELIALDRGPGIADINAALADGRSTSGTTGIGLGAIRRMSDEFDLYSAVPHGTIVLARFRARGASTPGPGPTRRFIVAGVSVAKAGEEECGDAWALTYRPDGFVAVLADGLGHGHFAAQAAAAVLDTVRSQPNLGCAAMLSAAHDGVRHTRGAAAAVAEVTLDRRVVRFAGVGNIGTVVMNNGTMRQAVSHNGTLGHEVRLVKEYTYPWPPRGLLVMHSDGLISHWTLERYPGLQTRHPALIAGVLYRDFNRGRDDVTVVVGREAA
jgi:anti-sigma regulatory factor (Ser/Thr protein kinase)